MNMFTIGVKDNPAGSYNEVIYANIASMVVSLTAFVTLLVLIQGYGWLDSHYVVLGAIFAASLTLLLNYFGFTVLSRFYLSVLPPIVILTGELVTLTLTPDGTHMYSFDVRVLILGATVLPILLFTMKEQAYIYAGLVVYGVILFFFDKLHFLFGIHFATAFGEQYYISTYFYIISYSFIVATLIIFKVRWYALSKSHEKLLSELEEKVLSRTRELEKNAEELVKKNNELEQFSFTVSHNVRGPVARLLGLTDLYDKLNAAEQAKVMEKIRETTVSLDTIISDLNEILQVRNNLYKVKEYVDISAEIAKAQQLLADSGQRGCCTENIVLDLKLSKVFGVRAFIQSIMYNLIGNAFKYKKEGVELLVKVVVEQEGDNVKISISDNGRGIDLAKYGNKIFGMYARFDLDKPGKGLGLYLVKKQVEAMNGTIKVDSQLNRGTTFSILLPVPTPAQIKYQKYFEDKTVSLVYDGVNHASLVTWKKSPTTHEFRKVIMKNLDNLALYPTSYWINDTTNFGRLAKEDQRWFNERIIPQLLAVGLKGIIIVNKEGKGFKSSQWNLLKAVCGKNGIALGFRYSTEEAIQYISAISWTEKEDVCNAG